MLKYKVTIKAEDGTTTTHRVNARNIEGAITVARYNYTGAIVKVEEVAK